MTLLLFFLLAYTGFTCSSGSYEVPGSGGTCNSCDSPCTDCYQDSSTSSVACTACNSQYFFDGVGMQCLACPSNCLACSISQQICDQCRAGYSLETNANGGSLCNLYWWVIFLWVFGLIFGGLLITGVILFIRKRMKEKEEEEEEQEIGQHKKKYEMTNISITQ